MTGPSPPDAAPAGARRERLWLGAWALVCAAVILLPHLVHHFRHGAGALPLADMVDAPMYYVLAERAPSPWEASRAWEHVPFADSGQPLVRRYISMGALAWTASCLGFGGTRLFLLLDFVCPLAFFWLLNRWLRELGAAAGVRLAVCAWFILCHAWYLQSLLYLVRGDLDVPYLWMNRPVNPQWSLLWYAAGLYLLWRFRREPGAGRQAAAALCGLYAESIQGPYLGGPFWIAWCLEFPGLIRRRAYGPAVLHAVWAAAAALLLMAWLKAERLQGEFLFPDPSGPAPEPFHRPLHGAGAVLGWTMAALLVAVRAWRDADLRFLLGAHLAVLAAANQHVVTGVLNHPDHFLRVLRLTVPLAGAVLLVRAAERTRRRWLSPGLVTGSVVATLFVANGAFVQLRSLASARETYDTLEQYRGALAWLAEQPPAVVACYSSEWAPGYRAQTAVLLRTPHAVLVCGVAGHWGYPVRERAARWAFEHRVRGIGDSAVVAERLFQPREWFDELTLGLRLHAGMYGMAVERTAEGLRRVAGAAVHETFARAPPFRVDYVVEGPFERTYFGRMDPVPPWLARVYPPAGGGDGAEVAVYRVDATALRAALGAAPRK